MSSFTFQIDLTYWYGFTFQLDVFIYMEGVLCSAEE